MFEKIDKDGNGSISLDELLEGIIKLLSPPPPPSPSVIASTSSGMCQEEILRNPSLNQFSSTDSFDVPTLVRKASICPDVIHSVKDLFAMMDANSYGEINYESWTFFYDTIIQGTMKIQELQANENNSIHQIHLHQYSHSNRHNLETIQSLMSTNGSTTTTSGSSTNTNTSTSTTEVSSITTKRKFDVQNDESKTDMKGIDNNVDVEDNDDNLSPHQKKQREYSHHDNN